MKKLIIRPDAQMGTLTEVDIDEPSANSHCPDSAGSVAFRGHPVKIEWKSIHRNGVLNVTAATIPQGHPDYEDSDGYETTILIPLQNAED